MRYRDLPIFLTCLMQLPPSPPHPVLNKLLSEIQNRVLPFRRETQKRSKLLIMRNNEPKVDKRCMTRTKGTRNKGKPQDGERSENDCGVAKIMQKNITRKRMQMGTEKKTKLCKKNLTEYQ